MSWFQSPFFLNWGAPAGLSGLVAWICLVRQYHGKGRLLGSARAALLSAAVVTAMAGIALLAVSLLPLLAQVPAAAVGVATGAGVLRRGRVQSDTAKPFLTFLTLGTAHLLERLEERMALDCADWCDDLADGLRDLRRAQVFVHALRLHLVARHQDKTSRKAVEERFAEAEEAIRRALETEERIEAARRMPGFDGRPGPRRDRTEEERVAALRAWGEARHHCALLLRVAYLLGRRSDRWALLALRDGTAPGGGRPGAPLPAQRRPHLHLHLRWFGWHRDGRGRPVEGRARPAAAPDTAPDGASPARTAGAPGTAADARSEPRADDAAAQT
ncbi:hypothetical protein [Streptomyces zingiberis]|uniref:FUSC family protein n=1 Tax=Streptomyces zingiberis TaxID=2053010 RepID=A0ABX1BY10_9ACTN|nr:hypothetical protein [Streptomyces zingiberis]NJQ02582.1 hypothetical protein [Streptomyces zingiberis]